MTPKITGNERPTNMNESRTRTETRPPIRDMQLRERPNPQGPRTFDPRALPEYVNRAEPLSIGEWRTVLESRIGGPGVRRPTPAMAAATLIENLIRFQGGPEK